ncbi:hypothetical protein DPMN_002624 [Dreissena polymorpha]|uniref:Uncharacterized protein n=1 Tax=Dreissena polymorpha TaxID=45954 RepID=A0A9D4MMD4_DREPO|nr:hypothetical protein DPMN_002624 [Dreissena polymorpha]
MTYGGTKGNLYDSTLLCMWGHNNSLHLSCKLTQGSSSTIFIDCGSCTIEILDSCEDDLCWLEFCDSNCFQTKLNAMQSIFTGKKSVEKRNK